jgi:hypothetical protein
MRYCQLHVKSLGRFRFTVKDDHEFNYSVAIDVLSFQLSPALPGPCIFTKRTNEISRSEFWGRPARNLVICALILAMWSLKYSDLSVGVKTGRYVSNA